jgi:carbon monoxide dehydrogenase subunit G
MARYVTHVKTKRPHAEVFAYMADLGNFAQWDPGVRAVVQINGDGGGPQAVFDVTVSGIREATLRYRTVEYEEPDSQLVVAESATLVSTDRITVRTAGDATIVTYDADLRLKGALRIAAPILAVIFRRIGDRAAAGLRRALDGVAVAS